MHTINILWIGLVARSLVVISDASAVVGYSNAPTTLPANVRSLGYEANSVFTAGNRIAFAAAGWSRVSQVDVVMTAMTFQTEWPSYTCALGYEHPITLKFFDVNETLLYSTN